MWHTISKILLGAVISVVGYSLVLRPFWPEDTLWDIQERIANVFGITLVEPRQRELSMRVGKAAITRFIGYVLIGAGLIAIVSSFAAK